MWPTATGIAVMWNIVYNISDLAGVGGEAVTNSPARSMAIAQLSSLPTVYLVHANVPVTMD